MIDNIQAIHEKLYKPLLAFTYSVCTDFDLAEHVVANVFALLLEQDDLPRDLHGWLFVSAKYEVFHHSAQEKKLELFEDVYPTAFELRPVEEEVVEREIREEQRVIELKVLNFIETKLSARRRETLYVHASGNHSVAESARIMGISRSTAKDALGDAVSKLRKELGITVEKKTKCLYGACTKERIKKRSYCKKHWDIVNARTVRTHLRKRDGWS